MTAPIGYNLVFNDDFTGTSVDTSKWVVNGTTSNVVVNNSSLILGPSRCGVSGCIAQGLPASPWIGDCTSTKFSFKYGYVEIYAKLAGPSTGANSDSWVSQLWLYTTAETKNYSEINLTETGSAGITNDSSNFGINKLNNSLHCPAIGTAITKIHNTGIDLSAGYHLYAALWTPTYVSYLLDGVETNRVNSGESGVCIPSWPMYIIIGICTNASNSICWPSTNASPSGSAKLYIDYVNVYQQSTTPTTYNCSGAPNYTCTAVTDGSGKYATLAACQTACQSPIPTNNFVQNPGFETASTTDPNMPTNWWTWYSGKVIPKFSYPQSGRTGGSSVEISYASAGPEAIYGQNIPLTGLDRTKQYTLLGWIKTQNIQHVSGAGGGACIQIDWFRNNNSTYISSIVTSNFKDTIWTQLSKSGITIPSNADTARVLCRLGNCTGNALFDDIFFG